MCGIFGATKREQFLTLYDLNQKRGNFATSLCFIDRKGDMHVHRWSGVIDIPQIKKILDKIDEKIIFYAGHTQAPTSVKRKYSVDTAHPFNTQHYTIAHNGVLTNFTELKEIFDPKWKNPVDSSIIPFICTMYEEEYPDCSNVDAIVNTLGKLEGTFGLWIYDSNLNTMFLARCGSTIFANKLSNTFSSVKFRGSEALEEGVLYQLTPEGITSISLFDCDSPFFT